MKYQTISDSIGFVFHNSEFVSVDEERIDLFTASFQATDVVHWSESALFEYENLDFDEEIDFRFLVDTQAFYFWGYPDKWKVEYQGQVLDGWWALLACFKRAIENGVPVLDGAYLEKLSLEKAKDLFGGEPEIPFLKQRLTILNKVGEKLVRKFDGRFHNFYKTAPKEAGELMEVIAREFYGFEDVSEYKGRKVYFYKKAKLLVADLVFGFGAKAESEIVGLEHLTGKADYKIPQILRKLGILRYSKNLAKIVDSKTVIERDSEYEVEIRANMLWATKLISERLNKKYPDMYPIKVDYLLWNLSQQKSESDKPYHLTETVFY